VAGNNSEPFSRLLI